METTHRGMGGAALVTGASRGLGRVIALHLARLGFPVCVNYRRSSSEADDVAEAIRSSGGHAAVLQADVSDAAEARQLVTRAQDALGPLSVVVANAGITNDRLLIQMSEEDWSRVWNTDLAGPRALCREALDRMRASGGRLVTVSSVVGVTGNAGQSNYAAAKSALQGMTRELSVLGAPDAVTVNCVIPGFFSTDATAHLSEQQRQVWFNRIPMGRPGRLEDVAALIGFLCSTQASYITGQCIAVDGGYLARQGAGLES